MSKFAKSSLIAAFLIACSFAPCAGQLRGSAFRLRADEDTFKIQETGDEAAFNKIFNQLTEQQFSALKDIIHVPDSETNTAQEDTSEALTETFEAFFGEEMLTMSMGPSSSPTTGPSRSGQGSAGDPITPASASPSSATISSPTVSPTKATTSAPSLKATTQAPTSVPITQGPTGRLATAAPTKAPTASPTTESALPTTENCGISAAEREASILEILDEAADSDLIRDGSSPQGQATIWLLNMDIRQICPDDPKILQRWALAVIYFSTGGDEWVQCSANPLASDNCGGVDPFRGDERFLSSTTECDWAGISCDRNGCVTEIEFGKYAAFWNPSHGSNRQYHH